MEWILASASPRRKQLLAELIEQFEIIPARGEERADITLPPERLVQALAAQKAEEVAALPKAQGKAVLGSDTVVALDGEVLGKPRDEEDAARMLRALSGRTHEVFTGVCIIYPKGGDVLKVTAVACTKVRFLTLTEEKIAAYVATGSPMDKAGAYGIQDGDLVEEIDGSFSNVVGLPLELCKELIDRIEKGE
ncbi:MAG: septum formation protein Maf [Clostridia bacterium]|nr:septum formation protein Maf [Clostridia bacterium]